MKNIIKGLIISALILLFVFLSIMLIICNDELLCYSNSIMIILTAAYGITTIAIWVANYHSANASKAQLEESKRQFEETKRLQIMPYIHVVFDKWIVINEGDTKTPYVHLKISECPQDECNINKGVSIKISNIGLGIAIEPICQWCVNEKVDSYHIPTSVLNIKETIEWDFVIIASKNDISKEIKKTLHFLFVDFYGNHYYQDLCIDFYVDKTTIYIDSYKMQAPKYIEKPEEAQNV